MSHLKLNQGTDAETADSRWNWLYKVGGTAALITAVIFPIQIIVFVAWPPPLEGTVIDWFTLFQENGFLGLLSMDLLLIADYAQRAMFLAAGQAMLAILVARRFFQLGRGVSKEEANRIGGISQ